MKRLNRIHIVLIGWLLFTVIDVLKKNRVFDNWDFFYFQYLPGLLFWILITLPLFRIFAKTADWSPPKRLLSILLLGALTGITKNVFAWLTFFVQGALIEKYAWTWSSLYRYFDHITFFYYMESMIIAWVMMIVFFMVELYGKYQEKSAHAAKLEAQLANAQLEALRMQLQPHFLFNAHNTVSMLIRTQKYEQATTMISKISDLLRKALNADERQFVSLQEELRNVESYLEIEQIRFEGSLKVSFEYDDSTMNIMVPQLILQPIIENAFKHGISQNLGLSVLKIKTSKDPEQVSIQVFNSGPAYEEQQAEEQGHGIGLTNVRNRLKKLYKDDQYSFRISNVHDGVLVNLTLADL